MSGFPHPQVTAALAATVPAGYGPADLQSAYSLPSDGGSGQTIAIVDAYDDPAVEADLAVYCQPTMYDSCRAGQARARQV